MAASRTPRFLGARCRRIVKLAPKKKAVVAISRNTLEIAWHLISNPEARFSDLVPDWQERHLDQARRTRQRIRELERLGYTVTHAPAA